MNVSEAVRVTEPEVLGVDVTVRERVYEDVTVDVREAVLVRDGEDVLVVDVVVE